MTPSGVAPTGRGGRKAPEALARLHSARSLNRSQGFTAGCRGSSLAPTGRRSFAEGLRDGDVILARDAKGEDVEGKIVIAEIADGKMIIRRYHKAGTLIHFSAPEGKRPVIRLPEEDVEVRFVVTSMTRAFE